MNRCKKIVVAVLALVICIGSLSIPISAESVFEPNVILNITYDHSGGYLIASIGTDTACGAANATLTYDADKLTLVEEKSRFAEAEGYQPDFFTATAGRITFVITAKDIAVGDTHWADFYFTVNADASGMAAFGVQDVQLCDIDSTLAEAVTVVSVEKNVSMESLYSLGAQYRNTDAPALRFATKLKRDMFDSTVEIGGKKVVAIACGYILGYDIKIEDTELLVAVDNQTGDVAVNTPGTSIVKAVNCLERQGDYLVFTAAVTGFVNEQGEYVTRQLGNQIITLADSQILARPYLVYVENGEYKVTYGEQISRSYRDVENIPGLLG